MSDNGKQVPLHIRKIWRELFMMKVNAALTTVGIGVVALAHIAEHYHICLANVSP